MRSLRPSPLWPLTGRSRFLIRWGVAYALLGWAMATTPAKLRTPSVATMLLPAWFWGALWIACGVIAIITGTLRWQKHVGFAVLALIGFLWMTVFLVDWVFHFSPRGWVLAVFFYALGRGALDASSGWVHAHEDDGA
jgi:hypothetical protein